MFAYYFEETEALRKSIHHHESNTCYENGNINKMHMVTMFINVYMNRMCCLASCAISLHISKKTAQNLIFDGRLQIFV